MALIPFAEYAPDRAAYDPQYVDVALNVLPSVKGYRPFPSLQPFSASASDQVYGFAAMRKSAGSYDLFLGTAETLEMYNSGTASWDDVSLTTYGLATPAAWGFAQFGPYAIAVNPGNAPQVFNLDSSSAFENLGGSPPRARKVMVVGDFLVMLSLVDDGRALAWSGVSRHDSWTYGKEGSDLQAFPDGGDVMNGIGSEKGGLIFQEKAIREMYFTPTSRYTFGFRKIADGNGLVAREALARIGGTTFYLDEDGFYMLPDGGIPTPIGAERVDDFFQNDINLAYLQNTQAIADPVRKIVYWRYVSTANANAAYTDRILAFNWQLNKWSLINATLSWFASAATTGYTLEGLDALGYTMETLPFSLDSRVWRGGRPTLVGFSSTDTMGFFDGANLEGTIETASVELSPGRRTKVRGFRVVTDASGTYGRLGATESHDGSLTWKSEVTQSARIKKHQTKASGRLHRFRCRIPAGATWEHATAISDIDAADAGA